MKYKVFFDSNALFNDKGDLLSEPFNNAIPNLKKFFKDHSVKNVTLCIPEIVVRERIQQKKEIVAGCLSALNERIKSLKEFGHEQDEVKSRDDYENQLKTNAENFIKKNEIERVATPAIDTSDLIERAISKKKPFNDSTAGFKDTLIYLSILNDALNKNADVYIFCSNNHKDFTEEVLAEFKATSGKTLHIVPDFLVLRSKLDELLPIGLQLKQRNTDVQNIILKNIGTLMSAANKGSRISTNPYGQTWQLHDITRMVVTSRPYTYLDDPTEKTEDEIAGYNFIDAEFISIDEMVQDHIQVRLKLVTEIVYREQSDTTDSALTYDYNRLWRTQKLNVVRFDLDGSRNSYKPTSKDFHFIIDVGLSVKSMSIRAMN